MSSDRRQALVGCPTWHMFQQHLQFKVSFGFETEVQSGHQIIWKTVKRLSGIYLEEIEFSADCKSSTHWIGTQGTVIGVDVPLRYGHTSIYDLFNWIDGRDPAWQGFGGVKQVRHRETPQGFGFLSIREGRRAVEDVVIEGIQGGSWHETRSSFIEAQHADLGTLPNFLLVVRRASLVDVTQSGQYFLVFYCGYVRGDALPQDVTIHAVEPVLAVGLDV